MRRILAGLAHALLLSAACGGGGSGGGSASTDVIAQGTITDTGSVTVAGIVFDTVAAVVELDGDPGDPDDLAVGMQVTVEGSFDPGGDTGTADLVIFDDDVEGPVSALVEDGDEILELTILGQTVIVEEPVTIFDGTSFDTIDIGDDVEVSGLRDGDGVIHATWVRLVTAPVPNDSREPLALEDGLDVEIEGIVSEFTSLSDFELDGQPVNAGRFGVEFDPASLRLDLDDGDHIEVEGGIAGGALIAQVVRQRAGDVRIAAAVGDPAAAVDVAAGTLDLLDTATLEVDASTRFDGLTGLADLDENDLLEVRGVDLGSGDVRPTEIRRVGDLDDVRVRGRVDSFDGTDRVFTIVGVEIETDGDTDYALFPPSVVDEATFFTFLSACPGALLDVTEPFVNPSAAQSLEVAEVIVLEAECTP